jgi:hypothetical protein
LLQNKLNLKSKYIIIASIIYLVIFFAFASGLVNSIIAQPVRLR